MLFFPYQCSYGNLSLKEYFTLYCQVLKSLVVFQSKFELVNGIVLIRLVLYISVSSSDFVILPIILVMDSVIPA